MLLSYHKPTIKTRVLFSKRGDVAVETMFFEKSKVMLKVQWYHCDLSRVPAELASKFVELGPDDDTIQFLQRSEEKSDWILTQIWHSIVKTFLGWFMTQTSING
jgi:hypothetical protein